MSDRQVGRQETSVDAEVHGSFLPLDVRAGERVACGVRGDESSPWISYKVWRLSPFGVELVDDGAGTFVKGAVVQLALTVAGQEMSYRGIVVAHERAEGAKNLLGVRFDNSPAPARGPREVDQRKGRLRWQCHRLFYPTGSAKNSARFNDRIFFRVSDISSAGLRLVTSLRNKHLVVGVQLDVKIQVPSVGDFTARVRVAHAKVITENGSDHHVLGVQLMRPSRKCLLSLGQYILQFGGDEKNYPTPKLLTKQGFLLQSIADALDYDIVRTDEEYRQVLELRSAAFRAVKGFGVQMTPEQMADIYDARSRILICRYRGRVVATTRLLFVGQGEKFEEEQYLDLPHDFPPRELVVGAARAAVHPDFRGSDLFLNIFRYVMLQTLQSGRRYILQSVTKDLIPVYNKVGFRELGITYRHPKFPGKVGHLLLGDCQSVLEGRVGSALMWNTLVPDIRELVETNPAVNLGWLAQKRLAVYQMLTPLYRAFERKRIDRRMKRRILENIEDVT